MKVLFISGYAIIQLPDFLILLRTRIIKFKHCHTVERATDVMIDNKKPPYEESRKFNWGDIKHTSNINLTVDNRLSRLEHANAQILNKLEDMRISINKINN